jgi:UDP-glucose:(heptosyl)LPS alpha-1,3-glucosyltransferase
VSFAGPVDDAAPYYAAADLYVHPTYYDTCSLVVLEAAAAGLPVITTRLDGTAELLRHGVDAWLISDPANTEELAASVRALMDGSLREKMGRAARQRACSGFDREHKIEELESLLAREVKRPRSPGADLSLGPLPLYPLPSLFQERACALHRFSR